MWSLRTLLRNVPGDRDWSGMWDRFNVAVKEERRLYSFLLPCVTPSLISLILLLTRPPERIPPQTALLAAEVRRAGDRTSPGPLNLSHSLHSSVLRLTRRRGGEFCRGTNPFLLIWSSYTSCSSWNNQSSFSSCSSYTSCSSCGSSAFSPRSRDAAFRLWRSHAFCYPWSSRASLFSRRRSWASLYWWSSRTHRPVPAQGSAMTMHNRAVTAGYGHLNPWVGKEKVKDYGWSCAGSECTFSWHCPNLTLSRGYCNIKRNLMFCNAIFPKNCSVDNLGVFFFTNAFRM